MLIHARSEVIFRSFGNDTFFKVRQIDQSIFLVFYAINIILGFFDFCQRPILTF